jgi:hypothetical protein
VFCPNCGTQNDSAATPCKKCGFKLSGISVPKFKGTMMLNSEQTVAEMIEEHRKKQAQGGAADKPKPRASEPAPRKPGSSAPPSSLGGPRGPVLQPPRVAAPTRGRMGGTMLGVAPQVGGHTPRAGSVVPPASTSSLPASPEPSQSGAPSSTEAAVATPPAISDDAREALSDSTEDSRRELEPSPNAAVSAATAAPARTRPLPAAPGLDDAVPGERLQDEPAPEPAALAVEPAPTADRLEAAPAAPRAVAVTAPLPRVPVAPASTPKEEKPAPLAASKPPSPRRLRPLDIALIICTCGVYGLVLWARQRKASA